MALLTRRVGCLTGISVIRHIGEGLQNTARGGAAAPAAPAEAEMGADQLAVPAAPLHPGHARQAPAQGSLRGAASTD